MTNLVDGPPARFTKCVPDTVPKVCSSKRDSERLVQNAKKQLSFDPSCQAPNRTIGT